jgi:antitoxin (DNA-binding transcriptional repressor) of toxin-antitoxin stability system
MKTATIRRIRLDFGTVLNWVEEGERVERSKRGKTVALITPPPAPKPARAKQRPDFAARLKRIYGDKVRSGNILVEGRDSRPD